MKDKLFAALEEWDKATRLANKVEVLDPSGVAIVASATGQGRYVVDLEGGVCTCPAFQKGTCRPCKHMRAVTIKLWKEKRRVEVLEAQKQARVAA